RKKFAPAKIILFGKALDEFTTGHLKNTKWEENGIHFLYTDTLKDMHAEQQLKLPFWNALKGFLFS
ncbi:MAG: hypothetical protein ACRDE2_05330, partial [Chitinophagaceae bacterium]